VTRPTQEGTLAPTRRRRAQGVPLGSPEAQQAEFDEAEIARGQSAAVLGALARMQLRLDVLAREQSEVLAKVLEALDEINQKLVFVEYEDEPPTSTVPEESS
jgi:hypothetical protein